MRRILILAPHPDDEVVGCAIAARRALAGGAAISVLFLTTGVPPRARRGSAASHDRRIARRREEARAACELLSFAPAGFLSWPARTLKAHLAEALAIIEAAIARERIDALWAPAYEGGHQDHDATNLLAARFGARLPVWEFAEYHRAGGRTTTQGFIAANGTESLIGLAPEEARLKRRALALYASERGNLAHIRCEREALRPLASYDYTAPPHGGRLFWTRFQWVPFRHRRIDFDRPEEVYRTLSDFAGAAAQAAQ